ncbi:MAG: DUF1003 domain-containing protein [Patescibacteria group bacterium]|jgi:uncharacterized membrane protein
MKEKIKNKNWHQKHKERFSFAQMLSDKLAGGMGSWRFIIIQTVMVVLWILLNVYGVIRQWDPYPFILLNLFFSIQAAYAAPIIMMSQNRQSERDRVHAEEDFKTNIKAKQEIEELQISLARIEDEKLNNIYKTLSELLREVKKK